MLEFSEDKVIATIQIPLNITEDDICNIIVTSLEGGSNYWLMLDRLTPVWNDKPKDEPLSTWATKIILEGDVVDFYDHQNDNEERALTLELLIAGIKLNTLNRPFDCDLQNMDADTADCIMQYALFGEVIYG